MIALLTADEGCDEVVSRACRPVDMVLRRGREGGGKGGDVTLCSSRTMVETQPKV